MTSKYERILAVRSDTTNWLIHFTKATTTGPALTVLGQIIRDGALKPGWSVRNGNRTVYGPNQAVCFTEMPLLAFLQYTSVRICGVSQYGVLLHKHDVFADGGRPVIYGFSEYELQVPEKMAGRFQKLCPVRLGAREHSRRRP
ncbi:MAG: hypothetical protein AAGA55_10970 [Planctomycetota bacterium]